VVILSINYVANEIKKVLTDIEVDKLNIDYIVENIKKEKASI
jgi:hypothetical protein